MQDRFAKYHPLVNFLYFTLVIGFSMALNHPLAQGISLACAAIYAVQAEGKKTVMFALRWCLPIMLLTAFMNPAAALMYNSQTINWEMLKAYYVSGLPMDLIHAAATVLFILLAAEPMLEKLDRIKVKYGLVE